MSYWSEWLRKKHRVDALQERERIDIRFTLSNQCAVAELKICYGLGTRKSIREALGQLLEYNHYPKRTPADLWFIILDEEPSGDDRRFIEVLRKKYPFPITIGWRAKSGFLFHPNWPMLDEQ